MKRRDFIDHVSWTGLGIVYTFGASGLLSQPASASAGEPFSFVQISDSHIGFKRPPNEDVLATFDKAIDGINAMPVQPKFVIHTGDITHLTKPVEFDAAKQSLSKLKAPLFTIPGEHDVIGADGYKAYLAAFPQRAGKDGWYSWDLNGVHFVALVNVFNFDKMGLLGSNQLEWLRKDLSSHKNSTPVVVFGHVPMYALYEKWGWSTEDGGKALALLHRFDNVTVLNGHIHQVLEHSEGRIQFRTAASTAFPQPAPGTAESPGPLKVAPDKLLSALGYRSVELAGSGHASVKDITLG